MIAFGQYRLKNPDKIQTPAFLVFEKQVRSNIQSAIEVCGAPERLVPHFKTHKSSDILKMTMAAGIKSYKCATLKEAEVLAENGVTEITLAFPLAHPQKAERFVALGIQYPHLDFRTIVSQPQHLRFISAAAAASGHVIGVYVDLDTGMHRTGVQPGEDALRFWIQAAKMPGLRVLGAHLFDGHTGFKPDLDERRMIVRESYSHLTELWNLVVRNGLDIVDNLVGNSWSFHLYPRAERLRVSPGTWIYWDHRNALMGELPFRPAALVLGQVVDSNKKRDTVTVDIGSKAISDDVSLPDRLRVVGFESMELISQSEEHGVLRCNGAALNVSDYILAVPGHVCTATVKYPCALTVNEDGEICGRYMHDARDRV